jgi:hypothetical protein
MFGRVDVARYQNGAAIIENFFPRSQGGLERRGGSAHVAELKNSSKKSQFRKFEFADTQAYALEFGDQTLRILKNRAYILDSVASSVTAIASNAGSIKVTFVNSGEQAIAGSANNGFGLIRIATSVVHRLVTGDQVFIWNPLEPNAWGTWTIEYVDTTHFDLVGSTATGAFGVQGSFTPKNIVGSTANNGAGLIRVTTLNKHNLQTGDKVYLPGFTPGPDPNSAGEWTITRISDTTFDLQGSASTGTFNNDGIYVPFPKVGDTVEIAGNTGTMALNGTWRIKSVQNHDVVTLANSTHSGTTGGTITIKHRIFEIATPYLEADVPNLYVAQSADFMWICHRSYYPRRLMRRADDVWQLATPFFKDGPYLPKNSLAPQVNTFSTEDGDKFLDVVMELSSYSHTIKLKSDGVFAAGDVGTYVEFRLDDQWRVGLITARDASDTTIVTVTVLDNILQHIDEAVKFRAKYKFTFQGAIQASYAARNALDPKIRNNPDASPATKITAQYTGVFGHNDIGKYVRYPNTSTSTVFHWQRISSVPSVDSGAVANLAGGILAECTNFNTRMNNPYSESRTATLKSYRRGAAFPAFRSDDVGRLIRLDYSGRVTWGKITAYTGTNQVTVALYEDIPLDPHNALNIANGGCTNSWRMGAWAARGSNSDGPGYPAVCCFHEQRLYFFRTDAEPHNIWGSVPADFENMAPTELDSTVTDSNSITHTIVSGEVSPIEWASSGPTLLLGGFGQEWQARAASSIQEPITPTNFVVTPQTAYGSLPTVRPQRIGSATLFVNRGGTKTRELMYNYELDAFTARDVSILSEHILRDGLQPLYSDYQKDPISLYWLVMNSGTMASLTYEKDQEILAWARQIIGGSGVVESMCILPTTSGKADDIYLIVKRTINGVTRRYIEVIGGLFTPSSSSDKSPMFFVDAGSTFSLSSRTVFEGLDYLEGSTVQVLADGIDQGDMTVASGKITLASAATVVTVGLKYESKLKILPIEGGGIIGTSQVKTKRTSRVGIRVLNTLRFKHSSTDSDYQEKQCDENTVPLLFTGDVKFLLEQGYNFDGTFWIKQDRPEPLTILLLAPELKVEEQQ